MKKSMFIIPKLVRVRSKFNRITPYCDIYIGDCVQSTWNNPYNSQSKFTVNANLILYKKWLTDNPKLMKELPTLSNMTMGCFCYNGCVETENCHGNIIIDACKDNKTKLDP